MLKADGAFPPSRYIDVRDSARSLVLGLKTLPEIKRKRVLVCPPSMDWKAVVEYIHEQRPELKGRVVDSAKAPPYDPYRVTDDNLQEILHFGEFISWKKTVLDAVDAVLKLEKEWANKDAQ
jgi:hypothetical protein